MSNKHALVVCKLHEFMQGIAVAPAACVTVLSHKLVKVMLRCEHWTGRTVVVLESGTVGSGQTGR